MASAGLLALNSYTVVQDGSAKTEKFLGKISDDVYNAGFHVVNPFASFEQFDIKENMFSLDDVSIPSQDKFKSNADLTVKWSIKAKGLPLLQRTVGDQDQVREKIISQPLLSILREAGRDVEKAQELFRSDVQDKLQTQVLDNLRATAEPYGIVIHEVYIKDITLDKTIQQSIIATKQLEEQESQERARLKQQELIYARQTAEAQAQARSAEQNKIATQHKADAESYRLEKIADANLYSKQKEAEGNFAVAKSVNAELLKLKDVEVQQAAAERWSGGCQTNCTTMGSGSDVVPLFHMNQK